jgi:ABC-type sugar transport system permease subunit
VHVPFTLANVHDRPAGAVVCPGATQQATGYASAISLVFFALVLTVSLIQQFLTRDKDA